MGSVGGSQQFGVRPQQQQNSVVWVCSCLLTLLHHSVCAVGVAGVEVVVEVASLVTNDAAVAVAAAPVATVAAAVAVAAAPVAAAVAVAAAPVAAVAADPVAAVAAAVSVAPLAAAAGQLGKDAPQVRNQCQRKLTKVTDQTFLLSLQLTSLQNCICCDH